MIRLPAQRFPPIGGGTNRRIAVLLHMHTQQIQLLRRFELIQRRIIRDGGGQLPQHLLHRLFVVQQLPACFIRQTEGAQLFRQRQRENMLRVSVQRMRFTVDRQAGMRQRYGALHLQHACLHREGRFRAGAQGRSHIPDRIPQL